MQRLPILVALALAVGGCGAQPYLLGTKGTYLFTARDALTRPGEPVELKARLQGGDFLQDRPGYVMLFSREGAPPLAAQTGEEGVAVVTWRPPAPGNYTFDVRVPPAGLSHELPEPQTLLIACRAADEPMAVVDLDRTLVATGFQTVLVGDPEPMAGSAEVMARLSREHTIVYLTHRPDYFTIKSKQWLRRHGYPRGPVLLSSISGFLAGSGEYKTRAVADLRKRFSALRIGIGDKPSDALAYHANELESVLIVQVPATKDPQAHLDLAATLRELPDDIHVVTDWGEVERALFGGASFPPGRIADRLDRKAEQLEAQGANTEKGGATP